MKRFLYALTCLTITFWLGAGGELQAQNDLITQWGLSGEYNTVWPILNDASTAPGNASIAGEVVSAWRGLQGGFSEISITSTEALVVKGKLQIVGADAGNAYTSLRYALTYQDSNSTLVNALTDSATWSHTGNHFGYGFHPRTSTGVMSNGAGGQGTVWTINNGNWASTWSNGGGPIAAVNQQPRNAEIIEGTYDFAISVISIDDTTNEVKWYMIEENNKYWYGGTVIDTSVTKKFNSILFGINDVDFTEFNIIGASAELGDPIEIPEAPWESYYVDQWGLSGEYNSIWPILNDSTTLVGDATIAGEYVSGWKGLQGGFGQDVEISTEKAIIVEGKIKFVGASAEAAYTPLRYALTYQDSNSTLVNALTDSATWSHTGNHFGYGFHPRTGAGTMSNGAGGSGTVWTINNGNWASTWSNGGGPVAAVKQQPRNAEIIEGTYDFAISVISIDDTTNEVKWYMIEENNKYWYGGTVIDTSVTKKFNGILFGINEVEWTEMSVLEVQIDKGDPIEVPEAPWESYYVDQWGLSGEYNSLWPILNDSTTLVGDATIAGEYVSGWKGLQGGFGQDVEISTEKAIIVEGKIKFVGASAEAAYTPLRYALTYQDSNSTLVNALTDSATWSHTGNHFGYGFHPRTGAGTMSNGAGGSGTVWTINNGNWASTWSNGGGPVAAVKQQPRNAEIIEGTYDFAISVISIDDTTNEVKWYMIEENNKYWYGGTVIDTSVTKKFNGILFGINEVEWTEMSVLEVQIDKGDPIEVPEAPWESYYVDQWGLSGEYNSIWPILNDSTTLVGDATIAGEYVSGWKGLQGGFGQDVEISTEKAIIVEGKIKFAGASAEAAYTPLRYALTYQDSNSTLVNALTDSATWSHTGNHFGYGFHPRTGAGTMSNGAGGSGTVWTINNGNWASTWSNGGGPVAAVNQQPRNAEIIEGTYDFAISVISIDDTTNEVKWYMIEENNKYWYGGTVIDTSVTKKFNGILFGINEVEWTEMSVLEVQVDKGDPIEVPEAPWESYYVDQWGLSGEYNSLWPILNDSTTLVGDATIAGEYVSGWKGLQGGFGQDVEISTEKAIIVEGKIKFVGASAEAAYTPLRYALTYQDSNSTLVNALTDSATWSHTGNHFGYGFHPRTGAGTMSNGAGGSGTVWTINNGNWASTWSNGGGPISDIIQIPRNAEIIEGTYDFAVSVRSIDDYTNEIKWYLIEEDNNYWYGGTVIDTSVTKKFNGILFGINEVEWTEMSVLEVQVDKGDPIEVPDPPFSAFYVGEWGFIGNNMGGWSLTPGEFTGNLTLSGTAVATDWVAIHGEFDSPVKPTSELALEIKGELILTGGGFEDQSSLRVGLFSMANAGTLDTLDNGTSWNGSDEGNGYLFIPPSGNNPLASWNGVNGTIGSVFGTSWMETDGEGSVVLSEKVQSPDGAVGSAGEYEFYLYVIEQESGNREIRYIIEKSDASYKLMGTIIDESPVTDLYNSINFALNSSTATALDLVDVHVDQIALDDVPVGVKADEKPGLPTVYALDQNYPNPFNPTTTIKFAVPKAGDVSLVVFDVLGRKVAELVNGTFNAGYYQVEFNASNLASGIYFYSIEAGEFANVKKLMLLK